MVLELDQSSYIITSDFRWSSSLCWTNVTERPGQVRFATAYWTLLTPQVLYNTTSAFCRRLSVWRNSELPAACRLLLPHFTSSSIRRRVSNSRTLGLFHFVYADANANANPML